jgi:uncharacterized glyoxalase superfamily protein PhnB
VSGLAAAMRYRDVAAASEWLCAAFGFETHRVVTSKTGAVQYAQLVSGDAMFLLAPVQDAPIDRYMKQPDEIGGAETQSCYLVVGDADAHYARARDAGAEIILDIQDDDSGGRGYSCRDPEGHIWSFGTHDPWHGRYARPAVARGLRPWVAALALGVAIAGSAATTAAYYGAFRQPQTLTVATAPDTLETVAREAEERAARAAAERVSVEQGGREAAERGALEAREQLVRERNEKVTAERALEQMAKRLSEETQAKQVAEGAVLDAQKQLDAVRSIKHDGATDSIVPALQQQVERERATRETAERNAEQANRRASEERSNKEAAERAVSDLRVQLDSGRGVQVTAEQTVEQLKLKLAAEQAAREAAERATKEAREQLNREQAAKNAAWKTLAQVRRQLAQVQNASAPAADVYAAEPEAEAPEPAPAPKAARPKQKQKTKTKVDE